MKGYGQFCPFALAAEIVGERWTPLVLRELVVGRRRFNDIHRGLPRMSPTLLARRLKSLEHAGIVERSSEGGRRGYALTEAGAELAPVVVALAQWGKTWLPATLSRDVADPDLIMWDMHRRIDPGRLPVTRTVVRFSFSDQAKAKRRRWIIGSRSEVEFCITDPGFEVDLYVSTDSRTFAWVWYGDIALGDAIGEGLSRSTGRRDSARHLPAGCRSTNWRRSPAGGHSELPEVCRTAANRL